MAVEKHYNNDWAKAKSRELVKGMVARTLLSYKKPKDVRVLCFPGIDCQEVKDVYLPLGIPPVNITGLERDKEVARAIAQNNPGINLQNKSLEDYVKEEPRLPFDVISLDFIGPVSNEQMNTAKDIISKLERDQLVLHMANSMRRDRNNSGLFIYGYALQPGVRLGHVPLDKAEDTLIRIADRTKSIVQKYIDGESLAEERKEAYSTVLMAVVSGATQKTFDDWFHFAAGMDAATFLRKAKLVKDEEEFLKNGNIRPYLQFYCESYAMYSLQLKLAESGIIPNEAAVNNLGVALLNAAKDLRNHYVQDAAPYSYISESGAPMVGDVLYIAHPRYARSTALEIASTVSFPGKFKLRGTPDELTKLLIKHSRQLEKFAVGAKASRLKLSERQFLGNSAKPLLTKKRAVEAFESGASIDSLKVKYRGWSHMPLPAWKAHVTMGTYKSRSIVDNLDHTDTERISKEDALDLLASGVPVDEIHETYPTSFATGQLRSFKAKLTQGIYQAKSEQA